MRKNLRWYAIVSMTSCLYSSEHKEKYATQDEINYELYQLHCLRVQQDWERQRRLARSTDSESLRREEKGLRELQILGSTIPALKNLFEIKKKYSSCC
jgi:hypothetical protein